MSDVNEVLDRISSALYRTGAALETFARPVPGPAPEAGADGTVVALTRALDDERTANAQLAERLRQVKNRHDARAAVLETGLAQNRGVMAGLDGSLQGLRQTNADLRDSIATLRLALTRGIAEPEMINRALLAEVEALNATRAADQAEVQAILAELKPLLSEAN